MSLTIVKENLRTSLIRDDGTILTTFDMSQIDIHPKVANAFMRAHSSEFGHNAIETQKQAFRCIRKLIFCLQENGMHRLAVLPMTVAQNVQDSLAKASLKNSTAQSHMAIIITVLKWCQRNTNVISGRALLVLPSFQRQPPVYREKIGLEDQRKILAACYAEITKSENRINQTRILLKVAKMGGENEEKIQIIIDLLKESNGIFPVQRSLKNLQRRVDKAGGLRKIKRSFCLCHEDILPYFLAVLIQTAGNPMSIRLIERDCIKKHPLRADLETIDWVKLRAGREQMVDFPIDKEWSAPNIIRKLINLIDENEITKFSRPSNYVFISHKNEAKDVLSVPSIQSLHNFLGSFIKKYQLRDFDFKDCRPSSAKSHHVAAGTIEGARLRLNHRDSSTTSRYTSLDDRAAPNDRIIAKFQGELIFDKSAIQIIPEKDSVQESLTPSETVFGFICRDPYSGINASSRKGSLCVNFTACSSCPGALIPVDDPDVVARILSSRAVLSDAKTRALKEGWMRRFTALYESTLILIEKEILPHISLGVLTLAKLKINTAKIPRLE